MDLRCGMIPISDAVVQGSDTADLGPCQNSRLFRNGLQETEFRQLCARIAGPPTLKVAFASSPDCKVVQG
jgi:hypothetical protein